MALFKRKKSNVLWQFGVGAASLGLLASFIQAVQTIAHYKNPAEVLVCEINSVFSCSSVFDAWQSSVFGFSNSLMCIVFFALSLGVLLSGLTGSKISKNLRLTIHFFTVFFLLFGAWYLWSSAFVIGALCIYCIFCYLAVIGLNWTWLRINETDLPLSKANAKRLKGYIKNNYDTAFWVLWGTVFIAMFVYAFA
jgi:uncharacterized membrane protein